MNVPAIAVGSALTVLGLGFGGGDPAAELSADAMMQKHFCVAKINSFKSTGTMLLINDKGQTRERKSSTYSVLQPNGIDSKLLVKFTFPTDMKGRVFLQVEQVEADDDEWIYLPALGKSRRLVANNKKDSFVGSDFSYGDISLPSVELYEHRSLGSEAADGQDCYKVESTPKTESTRDNSGYSRKITWLRKNNFVEAKVEYYDLSNRLLKTQVISQPQLLDPDPHRGLARHTQRTNQQTGHKTVLNFDEVEAAVAVPEDLFSNRHL